MQRFELDAEAGQVSAELVRRGLSSAARVHVVVEVTPSEELPLATMAEAGGAFDWLLDEPDVYRDADLLPHN